MQIVIFILGALLVGLTILSRLRSARWWIRFADFPRMQIAFGLLAVLLLQFALTDTGGLWDMALTGALLIALAYQAWRIFPYTRLAPTQVRTAQPTPPGDEGRVLRVLVSNVLMQNRIDDRLISLIREFDPDILFVVETDDWWTEKLSVLDPVYPHRLKQPQDNCYGLNFFSKLELRDPTVRFLLEDDIPSVRTGVRLRSGDWIEFYGLHPRPPEVQADTETRDAEILMVGREIRADGRPSIVAGDLNDVAWSHTTRLFQRISGTLDPRRGRGTFNTFHAGYPIFRWPLDHIFFEASFTLLRLARLPNIGSDHFPVFAELRFEPAAEAVHETPEPDHEDLQEAKEKIVEGRQAARETAAQA
ncbi:endonuclease [Rubellimicrobium rubrum]|uniref:Endonuclease n=1 Tax=Rubellimicrobium rubrum TaxID=2585369 RepID=A0A5C4MRK9_9RHOB|nr:endonuclease/exonuclease/phosphatase family protein [Rubellimicrobium rubrum]TNC48587.1 endonuclease [Rubellimicrobium rubrum]